MSVVVVNGVGYAAGLDWLPRGSVLDTAREARKVGSVWCAHHGEQTGYAGGSPEHAEGIPVLAAALRDLIDGDRWTAVVAGEEGYWAVVQVGDGVILGTGDRVFRDEADALAAVEEGRAARWTVLVAGVSIDGAAELDLAGLGEAAVLQRVPFSWFTRKVARAAGGIGAGMVLGLAAFSYRQELWLLWEGSVKEAAQVAEVTEEQRVGVGLDSVALVEGCREAVRRYVPELPGWERVSLTCRARFSEAELIAVRPVFEGRPVMAVRWRIEAGRRESLYRRIAENQLAKWKQDTGAGLEGLVEGGRAWVAAVLPPVAMVSERRGPVSKLALRKAVDMRFGAVAEAIRHEEEKGLVRIRTAVPLGRIAELVDGMEGFEVMGLSRNRVGWVVEGRGVRTVSMPVSKFRELRGDLR